MTHLVSIPVPVKHTEREMRLLSLPDVIYYVVYLRHQHVRPQPTGRNPMTSSSIQKTPARRSENTSGPVSDRNRLHKIPTGGQRRSSMTCGGKMFRGSFIPILSQPLITPVGEEHKLVRVICEAVVLLQHFKTKKSSWVGKVKEEHLSLQYHHC